MTYRLTIVNDTDEVLDVITLDGWDLSKPLAQAAIGSAIASGMGTHAVADCASRSSDTED